MSNSFPAVIIGSGIAGLATALSLAPYPSVILTCGKIGEKTSSILAQGGIAAAIGDDDSPSLHAEDTIKAGAGLCNEAIVRMVTESAPKAIEQLIKWGVVFDCNSNGKLDLGLEGAHSRRRIVHANGDSTGSAIIKALIEKALATPSIKILEEAEAFAVTTVDNGINGIAFLHQESAHYIATDNIIIATGGAGALWSHTTAPSTSWGRGIILAARAGANLRDLELMQFHPTAIDTGSDPLPLASESLRGEGAVLVNDLGENFMSDFPLRNLEPRDVISRAIYEQLQRGRRVFLDARAVPDLAKRFPSVHGICKSSGIDPCSQLIPVRPVAHYHIGGVEVDENGRTNVDGLWACGEVSSTELHGANRLASNSLLEAVVFSARIAEAIRGANPRSISSPQSLPPIPARESPLEITAIRKMMEENVGVARHRKGLEQAISWFGKRAFVSDMALVAMIIAISALMRKESRGVHYRLDFPNSNQIASHQSFNLSKLAKGVFRPANTNEPVCFQS